MATLEKLIKVSITVICSGCQNRVVSGRCSFVGCHIGTRLVPKFEARCSAIIEDETATANLFVQGTILFPEEIIQVQVLAELRCFC